MVTLKVIKPILDNTIKDYRRIGDYYEVSLERLNEMRNGLKGLFNLYFIVIKIKKN